MLISLTTEPCYMDGNWLQQS